MVSEREVAISIAISHIVLFSSVYGAVIQESVLSQLQDSLNSILMADGRITGNPIWFIRALNIKIDININI